MNYEWDRLKAASNLEKHGVRFEAITRFDWTTAVEGRDQRHQGELRVIAFGLIGQRLHTLVYTKRGERCRIISLRKANAREFDRYEKAQNHSPD